METRRSNNLFDKGFFLLMKCYLCAGNYIRLAT